MEEFDAEKARRVWQRVFSGSEAAMQSVRISFPEMADRAQEMARIYMRMAGKFYGQEKKWLLQMARQMNQHSRILQNLQRRLRQN